MVFFSHSEDAVDKVTDFEIISILVGDEGLTEKDVNHCLKNYKKLTTPEWFQLVNGDYYVFCE